MKTSAKITCFFPSEGSLRIVLAALNPDVEKPSTARSTVTLTRKDTCLVLKVKAKDTVALRATLNTYLRWIGSLITVLEVFNKL